MVQTIRNGRRAFAVILAGVFFWSLPALCFAAGIEQVHLSVTGDPKTSITVSFKTREDIGSPMVQFGTSPSTYPRRSVGRANPSPNQLLGYIQEVECTGLQPGTTYYYICGSSQGGWSPEYTFTTAPTGEAEFSFTMYGDQGTTLPWPQLAVQKCVAENPAFHLHLGDLAYAEPIQTVWDTWFGIIEPLSSVVAYMPCIGNHEVEDDIFGNPLGISTYLGRFALPHNERWYSFQWGNALFVALDTESDSAPESPQTQWLVQTLSQYSQDPTVKWRFVFFHKPPYSYKRQNTAVQQDWVSLFEDYHVDVVFSGHDHYYERTFPLIQGSPTETAVSAYLDPDGVMYLVSGGAGKSLDDNGRASWTAVTAKEYHYTRARIRADGSLVVTAMESGTGAIMDEFTLSKTLAVFFTPTPLPTQPPTFTPVPTTPPTPTPQPTQTPVPSATPTVLFTPTPVPTPTPFSGDYFFAGYWNSRITDEEGGTLRLAAFGTTEIRKVEILYQGLPTGVELEAPLTPGDVFMLTVAIPGAPGGYPYRTLLELRGKNSRGIAKASWPSFTVKN